jgi:hypothetical protein
LLRVRDASGRIVRTVDQSERRYTTIDLLTAETELLHRATSRRDAGVARIPETIVDQVVAANPNLDTDQEAMVRTLASSGAGVDVIVGKAGTGKSTALGAYRGPLTALCCERPLWTTGKVPGQRRLCAPDGIRTRAAGLKGRRKPAGQSTKPQVRHDFRTSRLTVIYRSCQLVMARRWHAGSASRTAGMGCFAAPPSPTAGSNRKAHRKAAPLAIAPSLQTSRRNQDRRARRSLTASRRIGVRHSVTHALAEAVAGSL